MGTFGKSDITAESTCFADHRSEMFTHRLSADEMGLNAFNMNREDGLVLSRSWKPLIHSLKTRRKPPAQE
jgi:hypothetical protein